MMYSSLKEEIPSAVFEPISPKEEISSLAETKIKQGFHSRSHCDANG